MHFDNPFFECLDHWLTAWVGDLDEGELRAYLLEPGGALDDEPISRFGADLGTWYDHDFIWWEGAASPIPVLRLCRHNDMESDTLIGQLVKRAGPARRKCLLILWNARLIPASEQREFAGGRLECLGSWEHPSPLTD